MSRTRQYIKRCLALFMALVTVLTTGGLEQFGGLTAQAAGSARAWSGDPITESGIGDMYWLFVDDKDTKTDVNGSFCAKRGTTLVSSVSNTAVPYSGNKLRILKAAWWFYNNNRDNVVTSIKSTNDRYVVGRLMTWAVTNGGASTEKDVINYINSVAPKYVTAYEDKIKNIISRAMDGEFDGDKVQLHYYVGGNSYEQPLIQGEIRYETSVTVELYKTGTHTGRDANLKGAVYGIYASLNRDKTDVSQKKFITQMPATDKNGYTSITSKDLEASKTYYVKEIKAPAGCSLDPAIYTVTTGKDGSVAKVNGAKGVTDAENSISVRVVKKDETGTKLLSGAQFTIYEWNASKGRYVKADTSHISAGKNVITTNADGEASTGSLYYTKNNLGRWKLVETKAPAGYSTAAAEKTFNTKTDKKTYTWTVKNNAKKGWLSVQKAAKDGDTAVKDAGLTATYEVFQYDGAGKKVVKDTFQTNGSGYGKSKALPVGDYYLREKAAAAGTDPSTAAAEKVTVTDGKTTVVKGTAAVTEKPWHVTVRIEKKDKNNPSVKLPGAQFTIYAWNGTAYGTKISTVTTNADGVAASGKLYYTKTNQGRFKITETKAPAGYKNSGWSETFQITKENRYQKLSYTVGNEPEPGRVSIQKGAKDYFGNDITADADFTGIRYAVKAVDTGTLMDTITLDASGKGTSGELEPGIYYIEELEDSVPDSMTNVPGKTMRVTVTAGKTAAYTYQQTGNVDRAGNAVDSTVQKNALVNLLKKMNLQVVKTDADGQPLAGAVFALYGWSRTAGKYVILQENLVSGADGAVPVPALSYTKDNLGKFKLVETEAPEGFDTADWVKEFSFADAVPADEVITCSPDYYKGEYSKTAVYQFQDVVTVKGTLYQALRVTQNESPADSANVGWLADKDHPAWEKVSGPVDYHWIVNYDAQTAGGASSRFNGELAVWTGGQLVRFTDVEALKKLDYYGAWYDTDLSRHSAYLEAVDIRQTSSTNTYGSLYETGFVAVNTRTEEGKVILQKEDSVSGSLVPGATFKAYNADGSLYGTFTDRGDGTYVLDNITIKNSDTVTLTIRETDVPYGYVSLTEGNYEKTVTLSAENKQVKFTVKETPVLGTITGTKLDRDTMQNVPQGDASLAGAEYTLYADEACTKAVTKAVTDEQGNFRFSGLPVAVYYVRETKAPEGYRLNPDIHKADIRAACDSMEHKTDVTTVSISLDSRKVTDTVYRAPVSIHKDSVTEAADGTETARNSLAGAGFSMYLVSSLSKPLAVNDYDALTAYDFTEETPVVITGDGKTELFTGEDGNARTADLPYGTYVLVETTVPAGHMQGTECRRVVTIAESDAAQSFSFDNTKYQAPIRIVKLDADTGRTLTVPGTKFKIRNRDTGEYLTETVTAADENGNETECRQDSILEADETGVVYSGLLESGVYVVEEVEAAPGYVLAENNTAEIRIASGSPEEKKDAQGNVYYEVTFKNAPTVVEFSKTDIATGAELPGAALTVTDESGEVAAAWVTDGTKHVIKGLEPGVCTLTEETAPDGYVTAESVEFTVEETGDIQKVEIQDDYTKVEISKTDMVTGAELPGAVLQLYPMVNVVYDEEGNQEAFELGTLYKEWVTTGEKTLIERIPAGDYLLKETVAPDGYLISSSAAFTVEETGEIQTVEMVDDATKTEISKLRSDWKTQLPGAVLQIISADGNVAYEFTTGEEAEVIYGLPAGSYTLHEVSAPAGFVTAADVQFVVKDTADIQEVRMEDDTTQVRIRKVDEQGRAVDGAVLQILNARTKEVLREWTTNADFEQEGVVINALPEGSYILHEVSAPSGYAIAEDIIFTVPEESSREVEVIMTDRKLEKPEQENPTLPVPTPTPSEPVQPGSAPQTGDALSVLLYAAVCILVSGFCYCLARATGRKDRKREK